MTPPDRAADLIAHISAAFPDNPRLPRGSLVYRGSWETESLLRNLARVNDAPALTSGRAGMHP